jgi:hypothetical protein
MDPDVGQVLAGVTTPVYYGAAGTLITGDGIPFLEDKQRMEPSGLLFPAMGGRKGRAMMIGDGEIFMSSFDTCNGQPNGKRDNNKVLLSNTFAWLAGAPGIDAAGLKAMRECGGTVK